MAKEIRKDEAVKFLKKSEEFYSSALENYSKKPQNMNCGFFHIHKSPILQNMR